MQNARVKEKTSIRKWDIFKVFLRSFFLQSVWNYRSLISIGFGSCLFPIIKRLYTEPQAQREFLRRHLKFFNAHPYLASYALGVSIKLEEEYANGEPTACERLDRLKDLLISILGAIGDRIFWQTIKPVSLIFGALGILILPTTNLKILHLILTFLIYNIPHFYLRYKGIVEGYQYGTDVYKVFKSERFENLRKFYTVIGGLTFGLFTAVLAYRFYLQSSLMFFIFIGSIPYAMLLYKIHKNFYLTTLFTLGFFIIVGFIFG